MTRLRAMTDSAPLRRLARRVRLRVWLRGSGRRSLHSVPAAAQIVVAAVGAYSFSHYVLGHPSPFIAISLAITSLGLARDARPRKVFETALGVTIGITLSELMVAVIGRGPWQIAIVIFVTLVLARAFSPNPVFAVAAAVQSGIVVVIPVTAGAAFTRSIDAVVAGVVALLVTALIPRNPVRDAKRDGRALFSVISEALKSMVEGLAEGDHASAELALERLRRTQVLIDNWTASLDSALSVAKLSPWLRPRLPELLVQQRIHDAADYAARHLRTIARRAIVLADDGTAHPELAELSTDLANAITLLGQELQRPELTGASRTALGDLARRLDPHLIVPDGDLRQTLIVVLMRSLVLDLLVGAGMRAGDARALLPPV